MPHVTVVTPRPDVLSAGLVCFSVDRMSPDAVVAALRRRQIIATVTPYDPPYPRLAPGLLNTPADVDRVLRAIRSLR
jgi:selenocysteine lyase/cysteine desulfurase